MAQLLQIRCHIKPDIIIHLQSSPESAMQRIKKRNRLEEKSINLSYIRTIHNFYEDWINEQRDTQIIKINAEQTIEKMVFDLNEKLKE